MVCGPGTFVGSIAQLGPCANFTCLSDTFTLAGPTSPCIAARTCAAGYQQIQTTTPSTDRVCSICLNGTYKATVSNTLCTNTTLCDTTSQYMSEQATLTSNRQCLPYAPPCGAGMYENGRRTITSDYECLPVTLCNYSTQYIGVPATTSSDLTCYNISTCTSNYFISRNANTTANVVCTPVLTCDPATQFASKLPTTTTDRQCSSLASCDFSLNEFVFLPVTATTDRTCVNISQVCLNASEFQTQIPTFTSDRVCKNATHIFVYYRIALEGSDPVFLRPYVLAGLQLATNVSVYNAVKVLDFFLVSSSRRDSSLDVVMGTFTVLSNETVAIAAIRSWVSGNGKVGAPIVIPLYGTIYGSSNMTNLPFPTMSTPVTTATTASMSTSRTSAVAVGGGIFGLVLVVIFICYVVYKKTTKTRRLIGMLEPKPTMAFVNPLYATPDNAEPAVHNPSRVSYDAVAPLKGYMDLPGLGSHYQDLDFDTPIPDDYISVAAAPTASSLVEDLDVDKPIPDSYISMVATSSLVEEITVPGAVPRSDDYFFVDGANGFSDNGYLVLSHVTELDGDVAF